MLLVNLNKALVTSLIAVSLTACSGAPSQQSTEASTAPPETEVTSSSPSISPKTESAQSSSASDASSEFVSENTHVESQSPMQTPVASVDPESPSSAIIALPKGAYRIAGQGIPPEAKPLPAVSTGNPSVKSPVGTVHCSIDSQYGVWCGDDSLIESGLHGTNENEDYNWSVYFGHKNENPVIGAISDAPDWISFPNAVTKMNVGDVYVYADFVFAATPEGLTAWSTKTNHGVFLDGRMIHTF